MLKSYPKRDLQHARSIMNSCLKDNLTLAECMGFLDRWIQSPIIRHGCPDCARKGKVVEMRKAITAPIEALEALDKENKDLTIYVCPECRLSEVEDNDN